MGLSELEGIRARRPFRSEAAEGGEHPAETPPPRPGAVPGWLKVTACVLFLALSVVAWKALPAVLYYVLFLIPNYVCGEYLGGKVFSAEFSESISAEEFSVLRIFVGVLVTLFLLGVVYGLAALVLWL